MADLVHFIPDIKQDYSDKPNVRCLNGSYHRIATRDIDKVTCEKCKSPSDKNLRYWSVVKENSLKGFTL
jgi:hypothetical protein